MPKITIIVTDEEGTLLDRCTVELDSATRRILQFDLDLSIPPDDALPGGVK